MENSTNTNAVHTTVREVIFIVVLYCNWEVICMKLPISFQKDVVFKNDGRYVGNGMPLSACITQIAWKIIKVIGMDVRE